MSEKFKRKISGLGVKGTGKGKMYVNTKRKTVIQMLTSVNDDSPNETKKLPFRPIF